VSVAGRSAYVDKDGHYSLPWAGQSHTLNVIDRNGFQAAYPINQDQKHLNIIIGTKPSGILQYLLGYIESLFSN
jgi:hypothetical protein